MSGWLEGSIRRTMARAMVLSLVTLMMAMMLGPQVEALGNQPDGGGYEVDQQKEVPPRIEGIIIPPMVHPDIPVGIKVMVRSSTPDCMTFWLDKERPYINLTCNFLRSEFRASEGSKGWVDLSTAGSGVKLNATTKNYEVLFSLMFSWSFEGNKAYTIVCEVKDPFGSKDLVTASEAYVVEKDLVLDGKPKLFLEDGSQLRDGDFCRGGAFVRLEGISVHFEGSPDLSPPPTVLGMAVRDSTGRMMEYRPQLMEQVNKVSFSFSMARSDGPISIEFLVLSTPLGSSCYGSASINLIMDSTPPKLGDPWYSYSGGLVFFSWQCLEAGSGINLASVQYAISNVDGTPLGGFMAPVDANLISGRMSISFEAPPEKDLMVNVELTDNVENPLVGDVSFLFTTRLKHHHDLAVVDKVVMNPEIAVEGQMVSIRARIENRGTWDERNVMVRVIINGAIYDTLEMGTIPAGSTRDHWWKWVVSDGLANIEVEVDPYDTIADEDRSNNLMSFTIVPEYMDVYADPKVLSISDMAIQPYEVVDITFKIDCIGTFTTGTFKVLFLQDDKYMGMIEVGPMKPDKSIYPKFSWKMDPMALNITLFVDPYNEVLESVESNNRVDFKNPFLIVSKEEDGSVTNQPKDGKDEPSVEEQTGGPFKPGPSGGTTWEGPEEPDRGGSVLMDDVVPAPYRPEPSTTLRMPPYLLPSAFISLCFSLLGASLFITRFEPARYKLALVLFPLYSKLRKNKVEVGTRFEILGYLKAKPGANYSELKEILDLNDGSLVHHLRVLEREEKIYSKKLGKYKLFYVASYKRQPAVQSYISPLHKRILEIISQNPGIVPKRLSIILDRSQTDISYHLSELSRNGFLDKRKKGRNIHYYINKELSGIIQGG